MLGNNLLGFWTQCEIRKYDVTLPAQKSAGEGKIDAWRISQIILYTMIRGPLKYTNSLPDPAPVTIAVLPARDSAIS